MKYYINLNICFHKQVRMSNGEEEMVPSMCFVIPPPNQDAVMQADR